MYSTVYVPKCSWLALWGFWRFFFDRAEQKVLELSEPEHFPQQAERSRWAPWDHSLPYSGNNHSLLLCSSLCACQKSLSWSPTCRFCCESWSNLKEAEYRPISSSVISYQLPWDIFLSPSWTHGASEARPGCFCFLPSPPGTFSSAFFQADRWCVIWVVSLEMWNIWDLFEWLWSGW